MIYRYPPDTQSVDMGNTEDGNGSKVTWQLLVILAGFAAMIVPATIWIGITLGRHETQITINTDILKRHDLQIGEILQHDANTTARIGPLEQKVERLTEWQDRIKALPRGAP